MPKSSKISFAVGRVLEFKHEGAGQSFLWDSGCPGLGLLTDPVALFGNGGLKALIPKGGAKKDVVEKGQLATWFSAVTKISNPVVSAYLQILLLTGARRRELSELRWENVDFQWNALWLKDKVEVDGRKVPLTPYVRHLLAALPRRNEWVLFARPPETRRSEKSAASIRFRTKG